MALIKASWTVNRAKAYAGQHADTSLYNFDGTCCAGVDKLPIGVVVALDPAGGVVDGHKVVTNVIAADSKIVGATLMSHAYSPEGFYDEGCATNVMTHGRIWLLCAKSLSDAAKQFDTPIAVNATGVVVSSGSVLTTAYKATGEWLKTDDADYDIIKVQIIQTQAVPAAAGGGA